MPTSTISSTVIANEILAGIGQTPITSLTDGSVSADRLSSQWEIARRYLLMRTIPWAFAGEEAILAKESSGGNPVAPAIPRYKYKYILPTDFLKLTEVVETEDYEKQFDSILASTETLSIYYIRDVVIEEEWSMGFVSVFAAYLRYKMVYAFTSSNTARKDSLLEYKDILRDVASAESQEKVFRPFKTRSKIRNSRFNYYGKGSIRGNYGF